MRPKITPNAKIGGTGISSWNNMNGTALVNVVVAVGNCTTQSLKTEPRIRREIGYILCKVHMCGNGQS